MGLHPRLQKHDQDQDSEISVVYSRLEYPWPNARWWPTLHPVRHDSLHADFQCGKLHVLLRHPACTCSVGRVACRPLEGRRQPHLLEWHSHVLRRQEALAKVGDHALQALVGHACTCAPQRMCQGTRECTVLDTHPGGLPAGLLSRLQAHALPEALLEARAALMAVASELRTCVLRCRFR